MSLVPMFVPFTVNMQYLKFLLFSCFKISCCQFWKTSAIHQRMIMLDERDEDNEQDPLEPVVERASTSFVRCIFSRCLGETASGWRTEDDENEPPVLR